MCVTCVRFFDAGVVYFAIQYVPGYGTGVRVFEPKQIDEFQSKGKDLMYRTSEYYAFFE